MHIKHSKLFTYITSILKQIKLLILLIGVCLADAEENVCLTNSRVGKRFSIGDKIGYLRLEVTEILNTDDKCYFRHVVECSIHFRHQ